MNVLVVGRGGREHSIVMKLTESPQVERIYVAPGNGGMSQEAVCVDIKETNLDGLVDFAKEHAIDFTIVGPEIALESGITNRFQAEGLTIFAPTKEAARLEGSKSFAKAFMNRHHIPTADYAVFTNIDEARSYIEEKGAPIVVKADGLAAGKGVVVAKTKKEALQALDDMLVSKVFSEAGSTIVIEEFLKGREFSLMAFVHEHGVYPMVTARDHKRAYEQDTGPNTGGMGAYAPVPDISADVVADTVENVLQKAANGLMEEGRPFTGILYAGLMMTEEGPRVIEFNTRFGDPETQVVLPLLKNDLLQVMLDVIEGVDPQLEWYQDTCVGVVLASEGYPLKECRENRLIPIVEPRDHCFTVFAGAKKTERGLVADGGRVLLVGAKHTNLETATEHAYRSLNSLPCGSDFFYRKDIGCLETGVKSFHV